MNKVIKINKNKERKKERNLRENFKSGKQKEIMELHDGNKCIKNMETFTNKKCYFT